MAETNGEGIYVLDFDTTTGALSGLECVVGPENPAYVAIDRATQSLHVTWEVPEWSEGLISSYAIDPETGELSYLSVQGAKGIGPSYISSDSKGRFCFASNYVSGEVVMLPIRPDGGLGEAAAAVTQVGSGPNRQRQEGPHPHCVVVSPDDQYVFAADLGADVLVAYQIDYGTPRLVEHDRLAVPPGSGPRHLVFHPSGEHAYLNYELTSMVAVLDYAPDEGRMHLVEEHSTVPPDFGGSGDGADLQVHPSGRWIYVSNRGHDSLATFAVDEAGNLEPIGWRSTEGVTPRSFALSPDGRHLLVANQDSDNIVVLSIDDATGLPTETVMVFDVPTPACLKFGWGAIIPAR